MSGAHSTSYAALRSTSAAPASSAAKLQRTCSGRATAEGRPPSEKVKPASMPLLSPTQPPCRREAEDWQETH